MCAFFLRVLRQLLIFFGGMTLAFIYILLGLGLNIVVGMAGMLDLGFVAFYAVGAYSLGLLHQYLALGFWSILPIAIIISGLTGVLLGFPVLRMHGAYILIFLTV